MAIKESSVQVDVKAIGADTAADDIRDVGRALDAVGKNSKNAANDLKAAQNGWSQFKDDFKSGFQFSAGFEAFEMLKDGVMGFIGGAIDAAAQYEQSMNLLQASSGATASEMEALRSKAIELGSDISLPGTSASDATQAMLELNKAGLDLNDTMDASRAVLQLAAAAQVDNATAAQIAANTLNTFGLEGRETGRVVDMLAAGANSSSASMTDLSQGMQQAGFAFKATNQDVDDLITAVAGLTNVGLTGSDAGTALKNAMLQLAAPTAESKNLMRDLGIEVRDATGEMKPFPLLIEHLKDRLKGLTPEQRDAALKTMLLSDGMKAMIPMLELGADGFTELKARVLEQGAAAKMAEAQNQGLSGAIDGFGSAMETLQIAVLEPLLPLMTSVVTGLSETIGWIGENGSVVIAGATAATIAWGAANTGVLIPSVKGAAIAVGEFMVAAAPFLIVGASIALVANELNNMTDAATEQTQKIREKSDAWQDAKVALDAYRLSQESAANSMKGMADDEAAELEKLIALRDEKLKRATGDGVGNWFKAAFDTDEVTQAQIAEIQELDKQIIELTNGVEDATDATLTHNEAALANEDAMRLSREGYVNYANLTSDQAKKVTAAFAATDEQIKEAEKTLVRLGKEGPKAMGQLVTSSANFITERENAEAAHQAKMIELGTTGTEAQVTEAEAAYRAQELNAATSYANQQAAHRAHLGVMLIDWINAQAAMDAEFAEKSGELINAISAQYGVVADASQVVWGDQLSAIRGYVDGSIPSLEELMTTLDQNEQQAVETQRAMEALKGDYIAELELRYANDELTPEEYAKELEKIPSRVHTEIMAEGDEDAAAAAARAQAGYDRMDRKIDTQLLGDSTNAVDEAAKAKTAVDSVPDSNTTTLNVDGSSVRPEAESAANDVIDGFSITIAMGAWKASQATRGMALNAIAAARQALDSHSPSREFGLIGDDVIDGLVLQIMGRDRDVRDTMSRTMQGMVSTAQNISVSSMPTTGRDVVMNLVRGLNSAKPESTNAAERMIEDLHGQFAEHALETREQGAESVKQFASGIRRNARIPAEEYEAAVQDIGKAVRDYYDDQHDLTRDHLTEVLGIWRDYYAELKEATDSFNSDKFDQQYDFFDRLANLDEADRVAAMARQQAIWDETQQIAQSGRADVADEYYQAALAQIEADQQRADQIKGIEQDIADTKKKLAEETDATRRAELEAELYQLESRKAYLEDLDKLRDERDASELERIKNQESAIAEERDQALAEENQSYRDAQTQLAEDFNTTVDNILGAEDRLLEGHLAMADQIIGSYESISAAAIAAGQSSGSSNSQPDGSHSLGIRSVPRDGYIAELHEGERVQTKHEVAEDRRFKQQMEAEQQQRKEAAMVSNNGMMVQPGAALQPISVHFHGLVIRETADAKMLAEEVLMIAKRGQKR